MQGHESFIDLKEGLQVPKDIQIHTDVWIREDVCTILKNPSIFLFLS